ncbi:tyrosinase [Mytilus galloprovincialis]|uniref:Tyrosinase n=1 Tax=Mytilus galloprovincialis TaxID=29158 RepID=A0A8B6FJI9_MYTGA|nr:tyrosinase [Mytilus galloprovincialis]
MPKILCFVLVFTFVSRGRCLIEQLELPPFLKECIVMKTQHQNVKLSPSESVCNTCLTRYMWIQGPNLKNCYSVKGNTSMTDITNFFGKLLCKEISGKRTKRDANKIRYRKEIRMLTKMERLRLRRAWNTATKSGQYAWLAKFHNEQVRTSAHHGPAFLGYHRFLILILELILQHFDPLVTLPYWNSGLDANMDKSENSILWTDEYLGEFTGVVKTGLCGGAKDNSGNPVIRNGGNAGSLFTFAEARDVMNMPDVSSLVEPSPYNTIESYHDDVHNYVGGTMAPIESAPWDCIFWLHHVYVDYLWEVWRYTHKYNTTYPTKAGMEAQNPNITIKNMPFIKFLGRVPMNSDGSGVQLARQSYYHLSPTCSKDHTDCGSPDLQCKIKKSGTECASVDRFLKRQTQPFVDAKKHKKVQIQYRNKHKQNKKRERRDTHYHSTAIANSFSITINADQITNVYVPQEREPCMGKPIQNNFIADCSTDSKRWAFIPIKVVHLRPREVHFASQTNVNRRHNRYDMYDEHKYKYLRRLVHPGNPAKYQDCVEDQSGAFKVRLKSSGLSYFGIYTDYVFVDNRLPVSSHIGYIAIEKPKVNKPTEVLVTASDACGRLCKPTCRRQEGGHVFYVPCSGAIKVTKQSPLMYGNDFGDAVLSIWRFQGTYTPRDRESNIYIEFFCDYSNEWIWKTCHK